MAIKNRRQLSILLTIIAVLLWAHSILFARFEIGYLGLIHSLPITFFLALAFLTAASAILWVSKEKHQGLLCFQLLIFVSALWLIPPLTGGSHHISCEAKILGQVNYIAGGGSLSSIYYLSWPGAQILFAALAKVGSINFQSALNVFPFLIQLLYLLPLYIFLRNVLGNARTNYCWAGLWFFSLANWIGQASFSPQGIAYFLLLMFLALITTPSLWERSSKSVALLSLVAVVFAGLVVTHLLTSMAALCILIVLCAVKRGKRVAPTVALCFILLVCWDFTSGGGKIGYAMSQPLVTTVTTPIPGEITPTPGEITPTPGETTPPLSEIEPGILTLDPGLIAKQQVTGHFSGSQSHIAVCKLRVLFSGVLVALVLVGAIFLLVRRKFSTAVPLIAIALAPLLILPISGYYGGELINRLYLFVLPAMAFFAVSLLDVKKKSLLVALCLILIVAVPLHVISRYGNQALDYISPQERVGARFFQDSTTHGYTTGVSYLGMINNVFQYHRVSLAQLDQQGGSLTTRNSLQERMPFYISTNCRDKARHEFYLGDAKLIEQAEHLVSNAANCDLIYNNPGIKFYFLKVSNNGR